jgi:hypothetical protein
MNLRLTVHSASSFPTNAPLHSAVNVRSAREQTEVVP